MLGLKPYCDGIESWLDIERRIVEARTGTKRGRKFERERAKLRDEGKRRARFESIVAWLLRRQQRDDLIRSAVHEGQLAIWSCYDDGPADDKTA